MMIAHALTMRKNRNDYKVTEQKTFITQPTTLGRAAWFDREYEINKLKETQETKVVQIKKVG